MPSFRSLGSGARLSTSQIAKRISKARGKKYHRNSIYNALRHLVHKGDLLMTKSGREKLYRIGSGGTARSAPAARSATPAKAVAVRAETVSMPAEGTTAHVLAVDEILVIRSTDRHVVSATNRRGRLVLKKHAVPK